jgi:hypothetical protein
LLPAFQFPEHIFLSIAAAGCIPTLPQSLTLTSRNHGSRRTRRRPPANAPSLVIDRPWKASRMNGRPSALREIHRKVSYEARSVTKKQSLDPSIPQSFEVYQKYGTFMNTWIVW